MNTTTQDDSKKEQGVLMPHMQHRFRVLFGHCDEEIREQISAQITSTSLDYANNKVKIVLLQPVAGGALHQFLHEWLSGSLEIYIQALTTGAKIAYTIRLSRLECIKHEFVLDYASNDVAKHTIVFKFNTLTMGEGQKVGEGNANITGSSIQT